MKYPEVKPDKNIAKKLVVFLHGLGSDGQDLIGLVPYITKDLPDAHFISPNGIEEYDMAPYGRQWFSLQDRTPSKLQKLLANNISAVREIITHKQRELNLTNKDTIIIGFSQGTMTGLYLTLTALEPFLALIGFSGALIFPKECINYSTPICLIHGEEDPVVNIAEMTTIEKYLSKHNIPYTSLKVPNLAHSIDDKGLQFAINFIKNIEAQ